MNQKRKSTKWILLVLVFLMSSGMGIFSFAEVQVKLFQWQENAKGKWYGLEKEGYYANTWAIIMEKRGDKQVGRLYCFDEKGYLRVNQVTPDGYWVNEEGALVADGQEIRVFMEDDLKSNEDWATGDPYLDRWITVYAGSQTQDSGGQADVSALTGKPSEIRIFRADDGKMYAEIYELKNGTRNKTGTYDFWSYRNERYAIGAKNGETYEVFYPAAPGDHMRSEIETVSRGSARAISSVDGQEITNSNVFYYYRYQN